MGEVRLHRIGLNLNSLCFGTSVVFDIEDSRYARETASTVNVEYRFNRAAPEVKAPFGRASNSFGTPG